MLDRNLEELKEALRLAGLHRDWAKGLLIGARNDLEVAERAFEQAEAALRDAFPDALDEVAAELLSKELFRLPEGEPEQRKEVCLNELSQQLQRLDGLTKEAAAVFTENEATDAKTAGTVAEPEPEEMSELGRTLLSTLGFVLVRAIDVGVLKVDGDGFPDELVSRTEGLSEYINQVIDVALHRLPSTDAMAMPIHLALVDYIDLLALYEMQAGESHGIQ